MFEHFPAYVFLSLLLVAALSDIATMKIPNWVSIALAAIYPVFALAYGQSFAEIGLHILVGAGMLIVGFALFQFKILGGGDGKLLAAAGLWVGLEALTPFGYWTAVAGGVLAVLLLLARSSALPHPYLPDFCNRLLEPKGGMPYGVAIFIGGVAAAPQLPIIASALTLP